MVRIRRGGKRIRGPSGGRTRRQDCCCEDEPVFNDCADCLAAATGVGIDVSGFLSSECEEPDGVGGTCGSPFQADYQSLNSGWELPLLGVGGPDPLYSFELSFGSLEDPCDPGLLLFAAWEQYTASDCLPANLYLFRWSATLQCITSVVPAEIKLTVSVQFHYVVYLLGNRGNCVEPTDVNPTLAVPPSWLPYNASAYAITWQQQIPWPDACSSGFSALTGSVPAPGCPVGSHPLIDATILGAVIPPMPTSGNFILGGFGGPKLLTFGFG